MESAGPRGIRKGVDQFVEGDRPCRRCGYNLRGLPVQGKCPECGTKIRVGRSGAIDTLVAAPRGYLRRLARGFTLLALAAIALMLLSGLNVFGGCIPVVQGFYDAPWVSDAAMAASFAWWIGVFIVTAPREVPIGVPVNPVEEFRRLRWINRLAHLAWPAWSVMAMVDAYQSGAALLVAAEGLRMIGIFAIAPLAWQLAELAHTAEDASLADSLRGAAIGIITCGVPVHAWSLSLFAFPTGRVFVLLAALLFLGYAGSLLVFVWGTASMARTCWWAVRHSREREARDWELRMRTVEARRHHERETAAKSTGAPE